MLGMDRLVSCLSNFRNICTAVVLVSFFLKKSFSVTLLERGFNLEHEFYKGVKNDLKWGRQSMWSFLNLMLYGLHFMINIDTNEKVRKVKRSMLHATVNYCYFPEKFIWNASLRSGSAGIPTSRSDWEFTLESYAPSWIQDRALTNLLFISLWVQSM